MVIAATSRLLISEFTTDDAEFILRLVNTPAWLKYIGDRKIRTASDALVYLTNGPIKSYAQNGFGLCHVMLKEENISIGMCGLIKRASLEDVDIGFAFLPEYCNKGYAFEAALAMLKHAQAIGLKRIVAITLPENDRSVKLLEKISMRFERILKLPEEKNELMLFSLNFGE
jgi:RimJ/RimL family protein N-acetyltransferase